LYSIASARCLAGLSLKAGLTFSDARREAKAILDNAAKGGDPLGDKRKAAPHTLKAVAEAYFRGEKAKLRTGDERERALRRLVFPVVGNRPIGQIKRSEIVRLLDDVEEENSPHQAQAVLAFMSATVQLACWAR
jgi:hypothetical protein